MVNHVNLLTQIVKTYLKLPLSPPDRPTPNFPPSWNVAPTDSLPVVRYDAKAGQRSLDMLRWGLISYWAKDINVGFANINAKAEGIESKPAFRKAFERRRCLVPVDNFYEWQKTPSGKQPYAIALADRGITTGCRLSSSPKHGRSGSARSRPTCQSLNRCSLPTLPTT
jgi:putative SOS response-associated peptidase YedK